MYSRDGRHEEMYVCWREREMMSYDGYRGVICFVVR